MADSFTSALALRKQEFDTNDDTWGTKLNDDVFERVDKTNRATTINSTGGTVALTATDASDEYIYDVYDVTGVLSSNLEIQWPASRARKFTVKNRTTGAYTVTVKVIGQTGVVVPQGDSRVLRCDGSDVVDTGIAGWAAAGGWSQWVGTLAFAANAYTCNANNHIPDTAFRDGMTVKAFFDDTNTGSNPTFKYGGLAAKTIANADGSTVIANRIPADTIDTLTYRAATDKWHLPSNPALSSFSSRVTMALGYVSTPDTLADAGTITWDMAAKSIDVSVILGGDRTLGNPTNVTAGQQGLLSIIQDGSGNRALALGSNYYVSGTTLGTLWIDKAANARSVYRYYAVSSTVILLIPLWQTNKPCIFGYKDITIASSLTMGTTQTAAHGLGTYPTFVHFYLQCITTDIGYSVGDRLPIAAGGMEDANDRGMIGGYNTTNVFVKSCTAEFALPQSGNAVAINAARWSPRARVFE